jgi:hypothetical protein
MNLKLFFAVCVAVFSNVALARTECPTANADHGSRIKGSDTLI